MRLSPAAGPDKNDPPLETVKHVALFLALLTLLAPAETLVHNNGFTAVNNPLPGAPNYASNVTANGANWDATAGTWGVTGTPDIALAWAGGRFDTYTAWDGRGNVVQLDASGGGSRIFTITFTPSPTNGVHIESFVLDAWSGGTPATKTVVWSIRTADDEELASGDWSRSSGRDTISPAYSGEIGQILVLKFDHISGAGDYLALDELQFDQIPDGTDPSPAIVLDRPSYTVGQNIAATFSHGPGLPGERIAIFAQDAVPGEDSALLQQPVDGTQGTVTFSSPELPPGAYAAWFLGEDDTSVLAGPVAFAVVPPPALTLDKTRYEPGENIVASFANGPGSPSDWIGIYPQGIIPSGNPVSTTWYYTNGTRTASGALTQGTVTFANPGLAPGAYHAWFLANNGYGVLAGPVAFIVDGSGPPQWLVDLVRLRHAVIGEPWTGRISAYVSSAGAPYTFEKTGGPGWLSVAGDGALTGTPGAGDQGRNLFTIRATGTASGLSADISLEIPVFPAGQENVPRLAVMAYNTWHSWGQVNNGFQKGIDSIVRSGADIVGLQESSDGHAQNVANALGWFRATSGNGSRQLVSRYPIVEAFSAGNAIGARIRLTDNPRRDIVVYSCHLDYQFYGPYAAQAAGATPASVLQEENRSQRLPQIQAALAGMSAHLADADNVPVFLTGDFNAPSHLDWTAATAPIHGTGPVAWPVSTAVENAGLLDSYRVAHPDPLTDPGATWSPIHKGTEPQDRIDFVYHKGAPLKVLSSQTFTTEVQVTVGEWGVPVGPVANNSWPSDHAAVLTTYAIRAVDSDGNGLSDAWEHRWFQSLGNDPQAVSNASGLSHAASMLLGLPPVGSSPLPLSLLSDDGSPQLELSLSDHALGRGLIVERSQNLENWQTLWAFDADPFLSSPLVEDALPLAGDAWKIRLTDPLADPEDAAGFFRLRWQP